MPALAENTQVAAETMALLLDGKFSLPYQSLGVLYGGHQNPVQPQEAPVVELRPGLTGGQLSMRL
jgi:hypothetical protein